ncbi:MAG: 2-(R)-hydroxypropyl-CoM dehydrogenase [Candidatus Heimdallarchaeota archaeon LC_2]|nr:MAG: 2-(R)-hydroxypropyl-CoM dehydrogenase [Candidatus Heimdallarchaeota archaeon LC_2]
MFVVITGSTKGIGLALAEHFLSSGDHVLISSRSSDSIDVLVTRLSKIYPDMIIGKTCDVTNYISVADLATFAIIKWGKIDIWVNNAGINLDYDDLVNVPPDNIERTVKTNIVGTLFGCKVALKIMQKQGYGRLFNMAGLGSSGRLSPKLATYGTTKRSIPYLSQTLAEENNGTNIGIHTISPGMVITDLIIPHVTSENANIFNILCEKPDVVANFLVPRMRKITGTAKQINYLTRRKVIWRFITSRKRKNRFFNDEGNKIDDLKDRHIV